MDINYSTLKTNFTKAPNELIVDTNLSDKDIRVWLYMFSRPPQWDFSAKRIGEAIGCQPSSVKMSLNRLIEFGYLERTKRPHTRRNDYFFSAPTRSPDTEKTKKAKADENKAAIEAKLRSFTNDNMPEAKLKELSQISNTPVEELRHGIKALGLPDIIKHITARLERTNSTQADGADF
jgi:DNA-binding MarR family transcriptional regulator